MAFCFVKNGTNFVAWAERRAASICARITGLGNFFEEKRKTLKKKHIEKPEEIKGGDKRKAFYV